jgi:vancomycin permeability regulator SanA
VLGAKVHEGGRLSDMLHDRMDAAIALYQEGKVQKLLLSGDGSGEWSEVKYMKLYALENGVREEDIVEDPEGYSTYETMQRAKSVYGAENIVAVTQSYHLYRAMYIARDMGMNVKGASADLDVYSGQLYRDIREILARVKDFGLCLFN